MGMGDYEYEEALRYVNEYRLNEEWYSTCLTTMAAIGGNEANWDMLDTVGIIVGDRDTADKNKIRDIRDKTIESKNSSEYYQGLYEITKKKLDEVRMEIRDAEQIIEDYF